MNCRINEYRNNEIRSNELSEQRHVGTMSCRRNNNPDHTNIRYTMKGAGSVKHFLKNIYFCQTDLI